MAPRLWYNRPKAVRKQSITSIGSSHYSGGSGSSAGIPEGLQLQLVLDGRTCPPCSIRDFNVIHPFESVFNGNRNILIVSSTLARILPSIFGSKAFVPSDIMTNTKITKSGSSKCRLSFKSCLPGLILTLWTSRSSASRNSLCEVGPLTNHLYLR
jgi:hypothetical protein